MKQTTGAHIQRQGTRWLLLILLLAVVLRLGVALYLGDSTPPAKDETSYSMLAARLAAGHGYSFDQPWYPFTPANTPTAHWSFLYTAFVAAIYSVIGLHPLGARLAGAILTGILLPFLLYRLSHRLFPDAPPLKLGRLTFTLHHLSALLMAVYAYFILYSAMVQTEALFICALLWSLERALALSQHLTAGAGPATGRSGWLAVTFGLSLGTAALLRQSILPWVVVLFAWLVYTLLHTRRLHLRTLAPLVAAGLVMLAVILPFTLRNYLVYGDFLLLNSNAGYAMYSAQHPLHGSSFQAFTAAPLPDDLLNGPPLTEAQWDRALMDRGIAFVLADPARYLRLSASRVADYFEFWPTETSRLHNAGRLLSFTLFLPFMLAGLGLAGRRSKAGRSWREFLATPVALALLFMLFYSLLHISTWAMARYRLPVDAVALPFAALTIAALLSLVTAKAPRPGLPPPPLRDHP